MAHVSLDHVDMQEIYMKLCRNEFHEPVHYNSAINTIKTVVQAKIILLVYAIRNTCISDAIQLCPLCWYHTSIVHIIE